MRLIDLEPEWVHDFNPQRRSHRTSTTLPIAQAQGIWFLCPTCFAKNGGPVGTHAVLVWFADRGVPAEAAPTPRWRVAGGSSFADLTLQPSIDLTKGADGKIARPDEWHGYITNGEAT